MSRDLLYSVCTSLLILFSIGKPFAQEPAITSLNQGNMQQKYDFMLSNSSNYQDFKVVKRSMLEQFYRNLEDSLSFYQSGIQKLENKIIGLEWSLDSLGQQYKEIENELETAIRQKNSFKLVGMSISKNLYNTIIILIMAGLAGMLALFVFRFKNSNAVTQKAKALYEKTREEFEAYRAKTLEKEQVLMRQLQDEINKNRGV